MSKQIDNEFNVSEIERRIRNRRKHITVGLIAVAIVTLVGMIVFWH